ncbi:alpha/beta-hydrolase [Schizopora paradoxa]|uniref:Carboxylic ester hydrolase n=1 Tax=Schizopora paradoxa TaxID=27342 RepID=A0A0H2RHE2_9AGAM|nr:alpha/beta-hydrolase [Schizopora paradoxa]
MRLSSIFVSLLGALTVRAAQNQLQQITANIGPNPNNVGMFVYKPTKLASPLPLIVAIHQCTGSATGYFESTQYATLADEYGFLVVYPNSPRSGSCFDVNTPQTLSHNGGGDSQGIASMVTYAISTYGVDASKVFVTGTSSGAMMTNVMAGSYPELFQAASVYSGVAFGCFAGASSWNSQCADGDLIQTPQQWGAEVMAAYPGYTGSRPRMMLWHGTADTTLYYPNYGEEIKEWTDVFGVSQTPQTTVQNDPQSGYTLTTYGPNVVGFSAAGVGHTVPVHETIDLAWFGITGPVAGSPPMGGSTGSTPPTTTQSTAPVQSSAPPAAGSVPEYGQCGGIGWTGGTVCAAPFTCKASNSYYSQCL